MNWTPFSGDTYLDFPQLLAWCERLAEALPDWVALSTLDTTRHGRPIPLLTLGRQDDALPSRPGLWIDAGTHASEWTGCMAALFAASRWCEQLTSGDPQHAPLRDWFTRNTVWIAPCVSPDGFQALHDGHPFLRSTLRPPPPGSVQSGFEPRDIDGDGAVRWMRWRHPAGPVVPDPDVPLFMRPRTLDDDPDDAFFLAPEGDFLQWDGVRWTAAPLRFGLDLNRNFPSFWEPFSMFGMDSGAFPLSEVESRAITDAVAARPHLAAALTLHTYTGCVLTQPYRQDSPLSDPDLDLMEALATDAVADTSYRVFRVHPDFTYDPKKPIVGVWADTLATTFGVPGYTVELWDPFAHAGVELDKPAAFFRHPDPALIRALLQRFSEDPEAVSPWRPFNHPQLGPVEIGGIDYLRTIRNPPEALLRAECERCFTVSDRVRHALPRVIADVQLRRHSKEALWEVEFSLENLGFLPTSGLARGEQVGACPSVSVALELEGDLKVLRGPLERALGHLDGWGTTRVGASRHAIYASLPARGHRASASWWLKGSGAVTFHWVAGRGGRGARHLRVG